MHGWLPVKLTLDSDVIEFSASCIPNNTLLDFENSLWKLCRGESSHVVWHTEPGGYRFELAPNANMIIFSVFYSDDSQQPWSNIFTETIATKPLLIAFWRALKESTTLNIAEPYWSNTDLSALAELKAKIETS